GERDRGVNGRDGYGEIGNEEEGAGDEHADRVSLAAIEGREEHPADDDAGEGEKADDGVAVEGAAGVHDEEAVPHDFERERDEALEEEGDERVAWRRCERNPDTVARRDVPVPTADPAPDSRGDAQVDDAG